MVKPSHIGFSSVSIFVSVFCWPTLCGRSQTPALLVDLDARDPSAGTETWVNRGSLGAFTRLGHPTIVEVAGVRAVAFDGRQDGYLGPKTSADTEGAAPRTIEVWAYNPTIDSDEETMVSWGKRGGPAGSLIAFGWGRNPAYGAMAHWVEDLGWNGPPSAKRWHYLVYSYDGRTARVYDNGVEKQSREIALRTAGGFPILLGMQTRADGQLQFRNEYTGAQQAGSLNIAAVRVRSAAMSADQIVQTFVAESPRYGARREDVEGFAAKGRDRFNAGGFDLTLLRATGTAAGLSPAGSPFDFLPGDRLMGRAADRYYHLGDCTLRTRVVGGE